LEVRKTVLELWQGGLDLYFEVVNESLEDLLEALGDGGIFQFLLTVSLSLTSTLKAIFCSLKHRIESQFFMFCIKFPF
jgi:hypothetical protein